MKTFLIVTLVLYAAFVAFAWFGADRLIFLPPPSSYTAQQLPVAMVPGEDGVSIATLHLPNPRAAVTLLYAHGNAEDLGWLAPVLERYRQEGFSVLAFDYRGYGLSTGGAPTTDGATRDMEAVYRHAVSTLGVAPSSLVLYGRSVGSGPATALAARVPVGGLVLEGGFRSVFRVLSSLPLLPFDKFENHRLIREVRRPVLVIHGTADEVIPFSHGRALFEAANEPKRSLFLEGVHHNELVEEGGTRYWAALREFAASLAPRDTTARVAP
jgi:fermentation-respiration switch protein FrsA (DUF1100 family)